MPEDQSHQQTVIIAVDFTDESEKAVKIYVERLHKEGNRVILLHCIDLPKKSNEGKTGDEQERDGLTDMWEDEESNLKILESKLTFLFMSHEIAASLYTVIGKPAWMIWRMADTEGASLIVLGSRRDHGKKSPFRSVIGSMAGLQDGVTDSVLKNASCPVVVCRSPQDRERRFSLFHVDRKFSVIPTSRQRCQSTSAVDVKQKASKKQRHSSGGESIAARIRRRFSSGGHRLMSVPSAYPGLQTSHSLEEKGEGEDSAFEPSSPPHSPGVETSPSAAQLKSPNSSSTTGILSATQKKKNSVTIEARVEVFGRGLGGLEGVDERTESDTEKYGDIRMKALQKSAVAAPAKA